MAVIFILLLLLFGAKKLPELARGMGRSLGEFKRAREEFEEEITRGGEDVGRPGSEKPRLAQGAAPGETAEPQGAGVKEAPGKEPYHG